MTQATALARRLNRLGAQVPYDLVVLAARIFPAMVYWQSARTKVDGLTIKDQTYFLFEHVYALPLIPPAPAAVLATVAEHVLPVLLVLGLFSRLSALGLLVMTAVIQIFVFPAAWVTHGLWAAALLVVVAQGPGRLSLDWVLRMDSR
jgi:putative oxidoreductase